MHRFLSPLCFLSMVVSAWAAREALSLLKFRQLLFSFICHIVKSQRWRSGLERVRALAPQAEGWVFESQPQQTQVVKTGSDSSTAKRSTLDMIVTDPRRWPSYSDVQCHSRCGTLKNPRCFNGHVCRA